MGENLLDEAEILKTGTEGTTNLPPLGIQHTPYLNYNVDISYPPFRRGAQNFLAESVDHVNEEFPNEENVPESPSMAFTLDYIQHLLNSYAQNESQLRGSSSCDEVPVGSLFYTPQVTDGLNRSRYMDMCNLDSFNIEVGTKASHQKMARRGARTSYSDCSNLLT